MRVVLIGPYPPYRGGIAHFAVSVRRELAARDHDVWALTFSRQYPRLLFPGRTELEPDQDGDTIPGLRVLDSINPLSWRRTGRRIRQIDPEAVIYSFWHPFFAPAYSSIRRHAGPGMRHVAIVHNVFPHERKPGDAIPARKFLSRCDGVLTMSEAVERQVRGLVEGTDVRRVAHPVYDLFGSAPPPREARRSLGLPENGPVGLFFGFVRPYKGLSVLLDALPSIVRSLPTFRLIVAGEFYEPIEPYLQRLERAGLRDYVLIDNRYIDTEDVGRYFAAADLVVQPYVSATQSGVAQIAWQFGRPIVVTDVGGLAEVVPDGEAGLVVPPEDSDALARAVVRFFGDGLSERLSAGARRQREKYSWRPLVEALEELAGLKA